MLNARSATRSLLLTALLAASALAASAGIKSERVLAAIMARTPAPRLVAEGAELKSAEQLAATLPNAKALMGIGRSMEPLYAANTAVVVQEINYDDIKKGMTVVYIKSNGHRVAHSVIGETRGGYIVQGVNNDVEDPELITPDNFVGVITHAFASADSTFRTETAKRLASNGKVRAADRT